MFLRHNYITRATLTPEDMIVKALHDLKHAIKGMENHKGKKMEALVRMEEISNIDPENKVSYRAKEFQSTNDPTKVLNF